MKRLRQKLAIQENMGVLDRSLRVLVGLAFNVPIMIAMAYVTPITWELGLTMFSFYLLLTGMMGWDPVYALFNAHTCGVSERNRCGSFTYEAEAALGKHPHSDPGYKTRALKPAEHVTGVYSEGSWI